MQIIKDNKSLAKAIADLENIKKSEKNLLKEHFDFTIYSLNPLNIIKEKFNNAINEPGLKGKIFKSVAGLATGYFANNVLIGSSNNPLVKIASSFVQSKISNLSLDTVDIKDVKQYGLTFLSDSLQRLKIK